MNDVFVVNFGNKTFVYDKEHFIKFCKNQRRRDWQFWVGDINSNKPLKPSQCFEEEELFSLFDIEDIRNILKYKEATFGGVKVYDMPLFQKKIYYKYGERMAWNAKF